MTREDLTAGETDLESTPASDHAITIALAALQAIPGAGPLAALLEEYIPRKKQLRLVQFVQELGDRFTAEQERIDREFVRTEEFEGMAEQVMDRVQDRKNQEKLRYWAALLIGVARTDRPARSDRERMIDTLDVVRLSHLELLHIVATTSKGRPDLYMGGVSDTLQWKMPGVPLDDIRRDWNDLAREDLVQAYPAGMMTAEGAGNLTVRLTPYGRQFIRLLELEYETWRRRS